MAEVVMNEDVRKVCKYARVISGTGENLGSIPVAEGLRLAKMAKMDLVLVSTNPFVCKMMDWHKEQFKKSKAKKKVQEIETKEIQFNVEIADHDLSIHAAKYNKWAAKDKVRVTIRAKMHGRWQGRPEMAIERIEKLISMLGGTVKVVKTPDVNGRDVIAIIQNY